MGRIINDASVAITHPPSFVPRPPHHLFHLPPLEHTPRRLGYGETNFLPAFCRRSPIHITKTPTIKNAPAVGLIDGNGDFSNYHLAALVLSVPLVVQQSLPFFVRLPWPLAGVSGYTILLALLGIPVTVSYWTYQSRYGKRHNDKIPIPGGNIEKFIEIKTSNSGRNTTGRTRSLWWSSTMHTSLGEWISRSVTSTIERRHARRLYESRRGSLIFFFDRWRSLLSLSSAKPYWRCLGRPRAPSRVGEFLFYLGPLQIRLDQDASGRRLHSKSADEAEINSQYDREILASIPPCLVELTPGASSSHIGGDDFYKFFLGPSMVYTSGIIKDLGRAETLEELQDNKLAVVCEKLDLQPNDRLLDIGCGWEPSQPSLTRITSATFWASH